MTTIPPPSTEDLQRDATCDTEANPDKYRGSHRYFVLKLNSWIRRAVHTERIANDTGRLLSATLEKLTAADLARDELSSKILEMCRVGTGLKHRIAELEAENDQLKHSLRIMGAIAE